MRRIGLAVVLAVSVALAPLSADAQAGKVYRIGFLGLSSATDYASNLEAFRQGLRNLGYEEGRNILIDYRRAQGRDDRLGALASELVRLNPEVLATHGTPCIRAAQVATTTIPIVMGTSADPVRLGLVKSLARPGGNTTGVPSQVVDLASKRLELLKEITTAAGRPDHPMMDRRAFITMVGGSLLVRSHAGEAQQAGKRVPRIGYLDGASRSANSERIEALRQGLRELGYVEGQDIAFEWRFADGKADRLPGLAAELVRMKVDLIVTGGAGATRPAKEATAAIPIVMAQDSDPVGSGFAASLARPGGNVTGLSTLHPTVSAKRLEILKEAVPKLSRVAFFGTSNWAGNAQGLRETELAAAALGVKLQYLDVADPKDFEPAFQAAGKRQAEAALMLVWNPILNPRRKEVAELAVKSRLPTVFRDREHVQVGGLMAYGPNIPDSFRRAATYVDKILKGAKPADLPVEQPTKFELVINMKTAKALGLTIPQSVLLRADEIIR